MHKSRPRKSAKRRRPTLSVCVIARDEERFIGDCVASALPFADETLVLDTGSTDRTMQIAGALGARVQSFEWQDDFAAARNAAIDLATGDWILMLDADERLQPASGPALRAFVDSRPTSALFYAPCMENRVGAHSDDFRTTFPNRLFRRTADLRYVGTIHEDLVSQSNPSRSFGLRLETIRITHLGYLPDVVEARGKRERNRRLVLRAVAAHPEDPRPWYQLGMESVSADQPAEAAEYFRESLARTGNLPDWTADVEVYAQLVWAYIRLKDTTALRSVVDEAERTGRLSAGARCDLAQDLLERGLPAEAAAQLVAALEPGQPMTQVGRPGIGGWLTRLDLARLYEFLGDPAAALRQMELVLDDPEVSDRGAVAAAAVHLAVVVGDMVSLARFTEAMPEPGQADLAGNMRLHELRALARPSARALGALSPVDREIALGDWQSAADAALRLSGLTMADAARMLFVAARLEGAGAAAAALPVLEHLYAAQPELPELHWVLRQVLTDLGRFDDALAVDEILQRLPKGPG